MLRTIALLLVLGTRVASAEDTDGTKSPATALALSAGGVTASLGMLIGGLYGASQARHGGSEGAWDTVAAVGAASTLVTPSLGEWYSGKYLTGGLGLRLGGIALAAAGVSTVAICIDCGHPDNSGAIALVGVGALAYLGGIILDVATAPSAAREHNTKPKTRVMVVPSVGKWPSGPAYGMGLGGSF